MSDILKQAVKRFANVTDSEYAYIFSFFRVKDMQKKDYLLRAGQVSNLLSFCEKGCLRKYHIDDSGEEVVVDFAIENYWVGDIQSFFEKSPAKNNWQALEDCILHVVNAEDIHRLSEEIPKLHAGLMWMIRRNHNAVAELLTLSRHSSAEDRYKKMIETFPGITNRVAAHHIASYLGIQPESLSRLKKKFAGK